MRRRCATCLFWQRFQGDDVGECGATEPEACDVTPHHAVTLAVRRETGPGIFDPVPEAEAGGVAARLKTPPEFRCANWQSFQAFAAMIRREERREQKARRAAAG
jgi:hypothetical protein